MRCDFVLIPAGQISNQSVSIWWGPEAKSGIGSFQKIIMDLQSGVSDSGQESFFI
jgi:hypothetical protein